MTLVTKRRPSGREPRIEVWTRFCGQGLLVPFPVHPDGRRESSSAPSPTRITTRNIGEHPVVRERIGRSTNETVLLHALNGEHFRARCLEPLQIEGRGPERSRTDEYEMARPARTEA